MFVWSLQRLSALEVTIDKVVMLQMVARTVCLTLMREADLRMWFIRYIIQCLGGYPLPSFDISRAMSGNLVFPPCRVHQSWSKASSKRKGMNSAFSYCPTTLRISSVLSFAFYAQVKRKIRQPNIKHSLLERQRMSPRSIHTHFSTLGHFVDDLFLPLVSHLLSRQRVRYSVG